LFCFSVLHKAKEKRHHIRRYVSIEEDGIDPTVPKETKENNSNNKKRKTNLPAIRAIALRRPTTSRNGRLASSPPFSLPSFFPSFLPSSF
jgi:hypothetical protein